MCLVLPPLFSLKNMLTGPLCWGWRGPVWQSSAIFHTIDAEGTTAGAGSCHNPTCSTLAWCVGPCPRPTKNSPVLSQVKNKSLKCNPKLFWRSWFANLHRNEQATKQFYIFCFVCFDFLNQWCTEPHSTLLYNFIRSFSTSQNAWTI